MKNTNLFILCVAIILSSCGNSKNSGTDSSQYSADGVVNVDGLGLTYSVEGEGIPCLVMGNPTFYKRCYSDKFKSNFKIAYFDSRIFAPGVAPDPISEVYTFDMAAEDIEKVRKAVNFEKVVIIGHSVHATMALEYAKKYPERVSHVVMITSAPTEGKEWSDMVDQYWDQKATQERKILWKETQADLEKRLTKGIPKGRRGVEQYIATTPKRWFDTDYDVAGLFEGIEMNNPKLSEYLFTQITPNYDISIGLENYETPTMLILGVHDYYIPPGIWSKYLPLFKNMNYQLFEKSGHFPMIEEADGFDETVINWVKDMED